MPKYKLLDEGPWKPVIEDDGIEFHSKWDHTSDWDKGDYNLYWIAEDAAQFYYHECDGWENWRDPLETREFGIYTENNKYLGSFEIHLEFEPSFSASKLKRG